MARGAHTRKPVITPQQKRAVELFKQHLLSNGTKSFEEILVEAGYSPESARQQSNVMAGIRPHLQPFIDQMTAHRQVVLDRMEKRVKRADYPALVRALDVLTKGIQLLGGRPTTIAALSDERRTELEALLD